MPWIKHAGEYSENLWKYSDLGCAKIDPETYCIIDVNQFFASTLGYTTSELVGKHVDEITDYADRSIGVTEIEKVKQGDLPYFKQAKTYLTKQGTKVSAVVQSFPIPAIETLDHFFSIVIVNLGDSADLTKVLVLETKIKTLERAVNAVIGKDMKTEVNTGQQIRGNNNNQSGSPKGVIWLVGFVVALVVTLLLYMTEVISWPNHNGDADRPEVEPPRLEVNQ